jgi:hypothetical protein
VLEFKAQIRLKDLILIRRIGSDVSNSSCAKRVVNTPRVRPGQVKHYGIGQQVPAFYDYALQVELLVEQIRID